MILVFQLRNSNLLTFYSESVILILLLGIPGKNMLGETKSSEHLWNFIKPTLSSFDTETKN